MKTKLDGGRYPFGAGFQLLACRWGMRPLSSDEDVVLVICFWAGGCGGAAVLRPSL